MSAHELEPAKEERPWIMGLELVEPRPGMSALKPGTMLYCKAPYWGGVIGFKRLFKRIVYLGDSKLYGTMVLQQRFVGLNKHHVYVSDVGREGMDRYYSREPSYHYCILIGLDLPDELKYEVVLFLPDMW